MTTSSQKKRRRDRPKNTHPEAETSSVSDNDSAGDEVSAKVQGTDYGRLALCLLAVLAIVQALYFARAILFPIALSIVLFFLLAPAVRFLSRFAMIPETVSAAIVVLAVTIGLVLASYVLSGPMAEWFANAPETFRQAEQKLRFLIEPVERIDEAGEEVTSITNGSGDGVVEVAIRQPPITDYLLSATVNFVAGATVTIVLVYLLLAMGHRTLNSFVELIPTSKNKRGFVATIHDLERGISGYLLTITSINVALGVVIGTVLGIIGLPDPLLLGIMAAALNFVPFAGAVVGAAVTFIIGVVYLDTPTQALLGPLLYLMINSLEGNVITPMILGRSMKLNPVFVFVFIVFWGWVWGVGGILIAVPLLGILKITSEHSQRLKPLARILTG